MNKTSKFDTEQELDTMVTRVFAPIVAVISVGALIILFACFWDVRRRSALLGKFFEARRSFQVHQDFQPLLALVTSATRHLRLHLVFLIRSMLVHLPLQCQTAMTADGSKSYTQIGNFNLRDHLDEVRKPALLV